MSVIPACAPERQESVRADRAGSSTAGADTASAAAAREAAERSRNIVFLGTSLTAGLGLEPEEAYPALLQRKIDSAGFDFRVINAGVSGETSAGGLRRIDWLLRQPVAMLVLELGANDGLRGQDIASLRRNLQQIVDRTRAAHPGAVIVIAGMEAPPNMGRPYTDQFRQVFRDLAAANDIALIPFLLEGVGGNRALNQADGIHPTAQGQEVVAQNAWHVLEPILRSLAG